MTGVMKLIATGASPAYGRTWKTINWSRVHTDVERLQKRIAKAVTEKKWDKVKALQWLLSHSLCAKLLAVRRVTSNKGAKTAGIDGITWSSPVQKLKGVLSLKRKGYRAKPLRRIEIPKKNSKKRKLGIPTIYDRAMQALYKLVLEPVSETIADGNSYGFRPHRACRDAIAHCFNIFRSKNSAKWILEADIKACFDEIDFDWLLNNIPVDRVMLRQWLKCGFMIGKKLFPTKAGTPQGGIISPTLANLTLDGLQQAIKKAVPWRSKVFFVRYADDFIVSAKDKAILEEKVLPVVNEFLAERGLRLSEEKTKITHIDEGFDFLSQNVRKYDGKLLIKPSEEAIKNISAKVSSTFHECRGRRTDILIRKLNPIIRGWTNYHRHIVSSKVFTHLDYFLYNSLWQWLKKRHSEKSNTWIKRTYFSLSDRNWFAVHNKKDKAKTVELVRFGDTHIKRHVKIKSGANPFNSIYDEYFNDLRKNKQVNLLSRNKF